jgi:hypothetical protein
MRAMGVAACLAIGLFGPAANGLPGQTESAEVADAFCWRGKALPACRSFALFELEGGVAVASTTVVHESDVVTTDYPAFDNELAWHLGAMRNLTEEWALGATVSLGIGRLSSHLTTGVRARVRRWLDHPMRAEIEAGVVDTGINDRFGSGFGWGPTVGARLNMGDQLSVFTRWEGAYAQAGSDRHFHREAGFHHGLYVGASAGSTAAAVGTVVLGTAALFYAYALSRVDW